VSPYYDDGTCVIYHGDCRVIVPGLAFDVVVTDPPYGIGWRRGANPARLSRPHDGILNDDSTEARDDLLRLCADVPALVFGSFYAPAPQGVRQVLVWHKGDTQGCSRVHYRIPTRRRTDLPHRRLADPPRLLEFCRA
jgi:hypothetical protein